MRLPTLVVALPLGSLLCLNSPAAQAASEPYTLSASTTGSPVALLEGGWSGDNRHAVLDLDFAAISPVSRTDFTATWTSRTGVAPTGSSTAATAFVVERGPAISPRRATLAPVLTDLHLESRQKVGSRRWSRWSGEKVRSYSEFQRSEYVGAGLTDCLKVARATSYLVQYRLTGSKGGTDVSGLTLAVRLGGTGC